MNRLPPIAQTLLRWLLHPEEREEVLAEMAREYDARTERDGGVRARFWLWRQLLGSAPALVRRSWVEQVAQRRHGRGRRPARGRPGWPCWPRPARSS